MRVAQGKVKEIQIDSNGYRMAVIECPSQVTPAPGQYLLAHAPGDRGAPLAEPLFLRRVRQDGFHSLFPIPLAWEPGEQLELRGPQGRGFELKAGMQNLAAVALGNTIPHLLALMDQAVAQGCSVALFAEDTLPRLPSAIEAHQLDGFKELLGWMQQVVISVPLERLTTLRRCLGFLKVDHMPCPTQILTLAPMPCGGMADCGVCAVPSRTGWLLACKDGPVFDLDSLDW
jgi:NAD(P)H-flavin reductase